MAKANAFFNAQIGNAGKEVVMKKQYGSKRKSLALTEVV